jgi:hypothetical protein
VSQTRFPKSFVREQENKKVQAALEWPEERLQVIKNDRREKSYL